MVRKAIAPKILYYYAFVGQVVPLIISGAFLEIALHHDIIPAIVAGLIFFVMTLLLLVRFMRKCIFLYLVNNDDIEFGSILKMECAKIDELSKLRKGMQRKVYFIEISGREYFMIASEHSVNNLKDLLISKG